MNTPTHLLVAAAALAKRDAPVRNTAVVVAAVLPDLSIFVLYFWARIVERLPSREIWRNVYWQEPWQTLSAISNSIPLWLLVCVAGLLLRRPVVAVVGGAALLHVLLDLPVHASDAHVHFWPFTDWRFHSPLSYWDRSHFGNWVSLAEAVGGIALTVILARRFQSLWVRAGLVLACSAYVLVPAYFVYSLGG